MALATMAAAVAAFYYLAQTVAHYDPDFIVLANPSGTIVMTVFPAIVATLLYAAPADRRPGSHARDRRGRDRSDAYSRLVHSLAVPSKF